MFSKSKLLASFLLSVSACAVSFAQETTKPTAPRTPQAWTQVFTNDNSGYLGIESQEVTKENFSKFGLRDVRGVAIQKVVENSPAAQAGLQVNDVIVRFNGEEVTGTRKLTRMIGEVAPDHQVRLTVMRGSSEREITATLGKRPGVVFGEGAFATTIPSMPSVPMTPMPRVETFPAMPGQGVFTFSSARQIGVSVSSLGKQLGEYFGVADGKGVLVNNVNENSPAAKAGLKAGDIIIEVDGKAVANSMDLSRAISEKKEGDVSLTIIRNKNRQTVRVTPEKSDNTFFEMRTGENSRMLQPLRRLQTTPFRISPSTFRRALIPSTRTI